MKKQLIKIRHTAQRNLIYLELLKHDFIMGQLIKLVKEITEKEKSIQDMSANYKWLKEKSTKGNEVDRAMVDGINTFNKGGFKIALDKFTKVNDIEATADAYYWRALCRMELRDLEMAVNDFTATIIFTPTDPQAYYNRAICILQLLQDNPAQEDKREVIKFAVNSLISARDLGYEEAGALLEQL